MTFRSKKLTDGARDMPCVLCGSMGTTVAAHTNQLSLGRGFAHKAPDYYVAYVCQRCHDLIDGRAGGLDKEQKHALWVEAFIKTVPIWFEQRIVKA